MTRAPYPSDLTNAQWERLAPLLPPALPGGRPRSVDLREVLNAIFYLNRQGCVWRALPHDLPPWGTVSYDYRRWRRDGTWQRLHDTLRTQTRCCGRTCREPQRGDPGQPEREDHRSGWATGL